MAFASIRQPQKWTRNGSSVMWPLSLACLKILFNPDRAVCFALRLIILDLLTDGYRLSNHSLKERYVPDLKLLEDCGVLDKYLGQQGFRNSGQAYSPNEFDECRSQPLTQ